MSSVIYWVFLISSFLEFIFRKHLHARTFIRGCVCVCVCFLFSNLFIHEVNNKYPSYEYLSHIFHLTSHKDLSFYEFDDIIKTLFLCTLQFISEVHQRDLMAQLNIITRNCNNYNFALLVSSLPSHLCPLENWHYLIIRNLKYTRVKTNYRNTRKTQKNSVKHVLKKKKICYFAICCTRYLPSSLRYKIAIICVLFNNIDELSQL